MPRTRAVARTLIAKATTQRPGAGAGAGVGTGAGAVSGSVGFGSVGAGAGAGSTGLEGGVPSAGAVESAGVGAFGTASRGIAVRPGERAAADAACGAPSKMIGTRTAPAKPPAISPITRPGMKAPTNEPPLFAEPTPSAMAELLELEGKSSGLPAAEYRSLTDFTFAGPEPKQRWPRRIHAGMRRGFGQNPYIPRIRRIQIPYSSTLCTSSQRDAG
jgi:hypothetical protein